MDSAMTCLELLNKSSNELNPNNILIICKNSAERDNLIYYFELALKFEKIKDIHFVDLSIERYLEFLSSEPESIYFMQRNISIEDFLDEDLIEKIIFRDTPIGSIYSEENRAIEAAMMKQINNEEKLSEDSIYIDSLDINESENQGSSTKINEESHNKAKTKPKAEKKNPVTITIDIKVSVS